MSRWRATLSDPAVEPAEPPANKSAVHESEVRAGEDHEPGDRPLRGRPEGLDRAPFRREAPGRHRGERVRDRFEEAHLLVEPGPAQEREDDDLEGAESDVDAPEAAGRVP